jgi:hypothetical protein
MYIWNVMYACMYSTYVSMQHTCVSNIRVYIFCWIIIQLNFILWRMFHVCMYVFIYVCMYVCTYVGSSVFQCMHAWLQMLVYANACISIVTMCSIHTCMHTYLYIVRTLGRTYVPMRIHAYTNNKTMLLNICPVLWG